MVPVHEAGWQTGQEHFGRTEVIAFPPSAMMNLGLPCGLFGQYHTDTIQQM